MPSPARNAFRLQFLPCQHTLMSEQYSFPKMTMGPLLPVNINRKFKKTTTATATGTSLNDQIPRCRENVKRESFNFFYIKCFALSNIRFPDGFDTKKPRKISCGLKTKSFLIDVVPGHLNLSFMEMKREVNLVFPMLTMHWKSIFISLWLLLMLFDWVLEYQNTAQTWYMLFWKYNTYI